MPTIDELASQVAALEQQMAAITTPPDKYYTSIYSGEEIDAAITKVRSGAMGVSSFNGRAGAVMPQAGDYNATQIPVSADAGAETVAAALNNKPNRNLLDNWYFVGGGTNGKFPVNQRGQTSYTSLGFTVDRWYMGYVVGSKVLKMELLSDGLQISASMCVDSDVIDLHQNLVNGAALEGKTVTGSVLMVDGQLYQATFPFLQQAMPIPLKQGLSFISISEQNLIIRSTPIGGSISNSIAAVKLELGSQQTLAHQDEDGNWVLNEIPDYGEELAKCQRYLLQLNPMRTTVAIIGTLLKSGTNSWYLMINTPVTMRTIPGLLAGGELHAEIISGGGIITVNSIHSMAAGMVACNVSVPENGSQSTSGIAYIDGSSSVLLTAEL